MGCSTVKQSNDNAPGAIIITKEIPKYIPIPDAFLVPCDNPGLEAIVTNGDMANRLLAYDAALERCSARGASLKELLQEPPQGILKEPAQEP